MVKYHKIYVYVPRCIISIDIHIYIYTFTFIENEEEIGLFFMLTVI